MMAEASDAEAAPAGGGLRFAIFVGGYDYENIPF